MKFSRVVYVESPYQLRCVEKYVFNQIIPTLLIVRVGRGFDDLLLQGKRYDSVYISSVSVTNNFEKIKLLVETIFFALKARPIEVVVGDARSLISKILINISILLKAKVVLVDDGLYLSSYIKNLLGKKIYIKTQLDLKISGSWPVIEKQKNSSFLSIQRKKACIFIGQKLVSLNIISFDQYLDFLLKVRSFFGRDDFIYYPHRGETLDQLKKIESAGITVKNIKLTIEEYFEVKGIGDEFFVSFYSTALLNFANGSKNKVYFVDIRTILKTQDYIENIQGAYEQLSQSRAVRLHV